MGDPVDRYLARHAEPQAQTEVGGRWDRCVVVPLRDETPRFLEGLWPLRELGDVLVIAVVNGPEASATNLAMLRELTGRERLEEPSLVRHRDLDVLVIDRASFGRTFERTEGVGRARKIGLDLGLSLWRRGQLDSPWLRTTDADATLSVRSRPVERTSGVVARVSAFWHVPSGDRAIDRATARYEVWLRHYVAGLAFAGSDWAMPTIGSTLEVEATAYAAVRGVPSRLAGEDFHLLAKLAKLGPVEHGGQVQVALQSRISRRVPFGTGPAVARAVQTGQEFRAYDPRVFEVLREVVSRLGALSDPKRFEVAWRALPRVGRSALQRLGLPTAVLAVHGLPRSELRQRRLREWFDAKRTLRFVHEVRDAGHPDLPWHEAVAAADWSRQVDFDETEDTLADLRRALADLAPPIAGLR